MSLYIVKPLTITDTILSATDIPEADHAAWNSGTTYALADRVILVSTHKIYQSLQASNTNNPPASSPTWWVEVSPTNRWKPFDTSNSTQMTVTAASAYYELTPGQAVNALALLNVSANSARVRVTDPAAGVVKDETYSLTGSILIADWFEYFFATVSALDQLIVTDLPPYALATLRVDFTANGAGTVNCGVLLIGYQASFGRGIQYGASGGIQDYSRKETNQWGDTVLTQRAFARRRDWSLFVDNTEIDGLERALIAVRATPCLWVGYSGFALTSIFGFYKDFEIVISYPEQSDCTLSIEGMT